MYYKGDYAAMNIYFSSFDWSLSLQNLDIQQCWDLFEKRVNIAIEKYVPVSCNTAQNSQKPWVNALVKAKSKNKRQAWTKLYRANNNHYLSAERKLEAHNNWLSARNVSTKSTDDARVNYETRVIKDSKHNPKTFWSYVKSKTKKPGEVSFQ